MGSGAELTGAVGSEATVELGAGWAPSDEEALTGAAVDSAAALEDSIGAAEDTGAAEDSGVVEDTGAAEDSGADDDAGAAEDSGAVDDTGAAEDTAALEDAGAADDAGALEDTGAAEETGATDEADEAGAEVAEPAAEELALDGPVGVSLVVAQPDLATISAGQETISQSTVGLSAPCIQSQRKLQPA